MLPRAPSTWSRPMEDDRFLPKYNHKNQTVLGGRIMAANFFYKTFIQEIFHNTIRYFFFAWKIIINNLTFTIIIIHSYLQQQQQQQQQQQIKKCTSTKALSKTSSNLIKLKTMCRTMIYQLISMSNGNSGFIVLPTWLAVLIPRN